MSLDHALGEVGLLDAEAFHALASVELKWARRYYRPVSLVSIALDEPAAPDEVRTLVERTLAGLTEHVLACGQVGAGHVVALLADLDHATVVHVLSCSGVRAGAVEWNGEAVVHELIERAASQR